MHAANKILVTILLALASVYAYAAESLFEEIDAANRTFASAVERGDIDYIIESYTDTACVIAPSTPKACSRESIRALWSAVVESGVQEVKIETQEVESSGELAYATGILTVTDTNGNTQKSNYVLVFKKVTGEWKLHLDIWTPLGQPETDPN